VNGIAQYDGRLAGQADGRVETVRMGLKFDGDRKEYRQAALLTCWVIAIVMTLGLGRSAWVAVEDADESARYTRTLHKQYAS
jgi:hypothetical protein